MRASILRMDPIPDLSALDLRMLPDWLRDTAGQGGQQHAFPDHETARHGRDGDRRRDDDQRPRKGGGFARRDGGGRPGPGGGGGKGPRDFRGSQGRRDDRRGGGRSRDGREEFQHRAPEPPAPPADVDVTILPDPQVLEKLAAHIRQTRAAHPLIALAHLFLAAPARYRLKIRSRKPAEAPIHSASPEGPVALDPAVLAKPAFAALRDRYYRREEITTDPPKGAFTSIARCPLSNTLLGPTNAHTFQPAIRALYERRFRNRMSFERYRAQIEIVSDPEALEAWKQQVSRKVVYYKILPPGPASIPASTPAPSEAAVESPAPATSEPTPASAESASADPVPDISAEPAPDASPEASSAEPEAPPTAPVPVDPPLGGEAEAFADFRDNVLPRLLRSLGEVVLPGTSLARCPDRSLSASVRIALAEETKFPGRLAHALQAALGRHGVHLWKHRKRHLFVSAIRPAPYTGDLSLLSERMRAILAHVEAHPRCSRRAVADALIGPAPRETAAPADTPPDTEAAPSPATPSDPADPARDAALRELADALHFLIEAGHLILFHNGSLDLPLLPRPESAAPNPPRPRQPGPPAAPAAPEEPTEPAADVAASPGTAATAPPAPTLQPEQ
jgi:hypothetical protein